MTIKPQRTNIVKKSGKSSTTEVIHDLKAKGLLWNQTANLKGEPSFERALMVYGSDRNSRRCNCLTPLKSDPAGSSFPL